MVILETERLQFETFTASDAPFYLALLNSPGWLEYIGDRGVYSEAQAATYIEEKVTPPYEEFGFGFYKVMLKTTNTPIGSVGLIKRPILDHVDIGFSFLPEYYRQGYGYESASAMLDRAINFHGLNPILAVTTFSNVGSQRLLEKIGLSRIGTTTWEEGKELLLYSTESKKNKS